MSKRGYHSLPVLVVCSLLVVSDTHGAEDVIRTPSEKMKDAVDK